MIPIPAFNLFSLYNQNFFFALNFIDGTLEGSSSPYFYTAMSTTASTTSTVPVNDSGVTADTKRDATSGHTTSTNNFDFATTTLENLSQFSSLLASPNQGHLFPLQSPMTDSMFGSLNAFPLTPTAQFMTNDIFNQMNQSMNQSVSQSMNQSMSMNQSNTNNLSALQQQQQQQPLIQPLQIMNSLGDSNAQQSANHDTFLLNSMLCNYLPTPAANEPMDCNLSQFEQQLMASVQNMQALDGLLDLQQIPMDNVQSVQQSMASAPGQSQQTPGHHALAQTAKADNGLQELQALQGLQPLQGVRGAVVSEAAKPSPNMLSNDNQIKREGLVGKSSGSRKRKVFFCILHHVRTRSPFALLINLRIFHFFLVCDIIKH